MPGMDARAPGAHRHQERVVQVAELLAADNLGIGQSLIDLRKDIVADHLVVLIVTGASLGGHGKALGHRQPDVGHFGKVRAFAAQQVAHVGFALFEQINVLSHEFAFPLIGFEDSHRYSALILLSIL